MREERGDADLARRFALLREEEVVGLPPYRRPATPPAPRRLPIGLAAAAAVAVTVAGAMWLVRDSDADALAAIGMDLGRTAWTSPTDFLLNTPGAEYLGGMPALLRVDSLLGPAVQPAPAETIPPEDLS